jgi:hypothetical protein
MKIAGLVLLAWAAANVAASAQTSQGGATAAPSSQNSGTGITGDQGNKNGPGGRPGDTVGSKPQNPTVQQQDASKVKGLPGGKSGPPATQRDPK